MHFNQDFVFQMINPLSNPVYFSMAVRKIRPDLELLGQFFDLTVEIYSFEALLDSIRLRTGSEPISQMSRLGWSLVSNNSRSSKYESTKPLGNFLMDTSMFLRHFIESNDFKSSKRSEVGQAIFRSQ